MSDITLTDNYGDKVEFEFNTDSFDIVTDGTEDTFVFDNDAAQDLLDALKDHLGDAAKDQTENEAKLRLAVKFNCRVKFWYNGGSFNGERRVEPSTVFQGVGDLVVGGETYDDDGEHDGYRQFSLSKIAGKVVVR